MSDDQDGVVWEEAILDASNSDVYTVEMSGDDVEWEFRDRPDFWTKDGKRRDGEEAPKLVAPATGTVTLRARSPQEARAAATRSHPEYHTVESVKKAG